MDYKRTPEFWAEHGHKAGEQLAREFGGDGAHWRATKRKLNTPEQKGIRKGIGVFDLHHPKHDKALWRNILRFTEDFDPDVFVFGGDNGDFEVISHWIGSKRRKIEGKRLKRDYAKFNGEVLTPLEAILRDDVERIFHFGNHEDWVNQYVDEHPEVEGFLEIENNLDLDGWGIYQYGEVSQVGKLHFTHGTYINIHNAYKTAQVYGRNIVYGHGHCFDDQTQLLTRRGWINQCDILPTDEAMTMNKDTEQFEWNVIRQIHRFETDEMMIRFKSTNVDLLVDEGHGMVWKASSGNVPIHYTTAESLEAKDKGAFLFRVSGTNTNPEYAISDAMLKTLAWVLSEGSISYIGNTPYIDIAQSKPQYIAEITMLLDTLGLSYRLAERAKSEVSKLTPYRFRIHADSSRLLLTELPEGKAVPYWLTKLSHRQVELFVSEYVKGDGSTGSRPNVRCIYTNDPAWIDAFQTLLFSNGYRTNVYYKPNGTHFNRTRPCAQINFTPLVWSWLRTDNVSRERYVGTKWCVSVDNGTLVVRRNGNTCVTQNTLQCHTATSPLDTESHTATQIPCACGLNPSYRKNQPNSWLSGFCVFYVLPDGTFQLYPIVAIDGRFIAPDGTLYE